MDYLSSSLVTASFNSKGECDFFSGIIVGEGSASFSCNGDLTPSTIKPIDLVRAGRLATSVKKRYVIATVLSDQQIRYYVFQWNRP